MPQIKDRWEGLEKKVVNFREKHPEAKVICIAMIGNTYRFKGDEIMEQAFAQLPVVKDAYKEAVLQGSQNFFQQAVTLTDTETESLEQALRKHCFDMDMAEMRYLIGAAVTPITAPSAREKRRNFYENFDNCPEWWRRTSVPFASLNHPKAGQRRATICQAYELMESLQEHFEIVPFPPSKQRRVDYRSKFHDPFTSLAVPSTTSPDSVPPPSAPGSVPPPAAPGSVPPPSAPGSVPPPSAPGSVPPPAAPGSVPPPSAPGSVPPPAPPGFVPPPAAPGSVSPPAAPGSFPPPSAPGSVPPPAPTGSVPPPSAPGSVPPPSAPGSVPPPAAPGSFPPPSAPGSVPPPSAPGSVPPPSAPGSVPPPSAPGSVSPPSAPGSVPPPAAPGSVPPPSAPGSVPPPSAPGSVPPPAAPVSVPSPDGPGSAPPPSAPGSVPPPSHSITFAARDCQTESLAYKRRQIIALVNESIQNNSIQILKILGDSSWNDLLVLTDEVVGHLPEIPTSLSTCWKTKKLLEFNPKYIDFIPESVGKRMALTSKSDGNCLFNSFSTILYGDEQCAFLLRLMFVVLMASKVLEYSKYIAEEYGDDCQMWLSAVSGSDYEIPEHLSYPEKIEVLCRQELLLTSKLPYRDCNLFHIHALSSILGRPVINHFGRKGMEIPFMKDIFPALADLRFSAAIHLLWVPSKPTRYGSLRHVVPLVCEPGPFGAHFEECAFEGMGICAFTAGANPSVSPVWVECTLCGQWVHDTCMMIQGSSYTEDDVFICGCDRLIDGQIFLERILGRFWEAESKDSFIIAQKENILIEFNVISLSKLNISIGGYHGLT